MTNQELSTVRPIDLRPLSSIIIAILLATTMSRRAHADDVDIRSFDYLDVVETNDGSVWKGVVVEQQPGVQYKLVTSDGSVHVIKASDVVKLTKQRNPWRVAAAGVPTGPDVGNTAVGARMSSGSGLPAPFVTSGLRASAALAVLFGTGDLKDTPTSFAPDLRLGYEQLFGNFGLEGGGFLRWTDWRFGMPTDNMVWTLETHVYGRAALHISRAAPYVGVSIGTDTNYVYVSAVDTSRTAVGFGMNVQFGLPIAATPSFAFELGGDYHPGTDTIADGAPQSISYVALRISGVGRF